ncbi:hypothetical protein HU155_00340 [Metamycoplasma hominis]|uniref:hypothetical protein n=1 Tax=Metamycoplasma hominis TaxID=2098 RepID=UPI0015941AC1|nr:hypothetical protein [Metamycoplasma hominis]QKX37559.1 hypothetical protein HU155_00340 [Metamycoplasma hominis]
MKIKLPNWKDLGLNIKQILWDHNYKTFEEFKNAHSARFCALLGNYLNKKGIHTKENFLFAYNVIFYYGYINQKREQDLLNILVNNNYLVSPTYMILDAVVGIDLIAVSDKGSYVIQVKPNNNFVNKKHIETYANNHGYIVVFAYKKGSKWNFLDKNLNKCTLF